MPRKSTDIADAASLPLPTSEQLLATVLDLGREIHLEMSESEIAERFVGTLSELFPERAIAVRVFDPRTGEPAITVAFGGALRSGVESERVTLKPTAIEKTRLKAAVASSARIRIRDRWDSPFHGVATGFTVPLVASGEMYGTLDVGYPLGADMTESDEPLVLPIANHLSIVLRNERLHRETMTLRDYNATLIEHANALILGIDRNWRVTVCNQAVCRLVGFSRSELLGTDLRDWLPREDRGRLTKVFLGALSGRLNDTVEVGLATKGGDHVRTVWSVAAISRRGKVEAVVAVGQDQTKVRELQSQVIQAEKLATLGQLAAGVVHELNNPLTSISVYADFLLKKAQRAADSGGASLDASDVEKIERINSGAARIMSFAKDLVQYAKPTGADERLVALNDIVEQSLSFCEHLFSRHGIRLNIELAAARPRVSAVPGQLEQVVINLVTNAVHAASNAESGNVWVTTFDNGRSAGIRVEDDGEGIPPERRDRIFEPFFTTKGAGDGTGLGLSIVRNIVERHKGRISVGESAAGGASFAVLVPLDGEALD